MKGFAITSLRNEEPIDVMVQYELNLKKSSKAIESLDRPNDVVEARANLVAKYKNELKKYIFGENGEIIKKVLDAIILKALQKNLSVKEVIVRYSEIDKKPSKEKPQLQVATVWELWKIANNPAYVPENKIDYPDEKVA